MNMMFKYYSGPLGIKQALPGHIRMRSDLQGATKPTTNTFWKDRSSHLYPANF
jgi:hypothetical protein